MCEGQGSFPALPSTLRVHTRTRLVWQLLVNLYLVFPIFKILILIDSYALYQLDVISFRSKKAWLGNTSLLVLASEWPNDDLRIPLEEYLAKGGQCLSLHPFYPKWLTGSQLQGFVKYASDQGMLISPVENLDFAEALPPILEQYFRLKSRVSNPEGPPNESQQIVGHLIAEPYHQEAFFRNFGRQSADMMTLEIKKSFSVNSQQQPVIVRRNISSRFNHRDYFDVSNCSFFLPIVDLLIVICLCYEDAENQNPGSNLPVFRRGWINPLSSGGK